MKKEQLLGLIRELLMAVGAGLVTFGVQISQGGIEASIGAILVLVSLAWSIRNREGAETVFTLIRKLLSAAGGVGVAFGLMSPEKLEALVAIVGPLIAIVWSAYSKGGSLPPGTTAFLLFLTIGCVSTGQVSCAGFGPVSFTQDGCLLQSYEKDGQHFKAGVCVDDEGKVNRGRVQWANAEGQLVRMTVYKGGSPLIEYQVADGVWVRWTSKSGVVIGPVPPQVEPALEGKAVEPEDLSEEQLKKDLGSLY